MSRKKRLKQGTAVRPKRNVTTAKAPWNGDHGTGTQAANADTTLEPMPDSPNRMAQRRRLDRVRELATTLTMRQHQAAQEIQNAYCCNEMLSSGGPLKERVQASPKPDATVAMQVDAQSRLHRATKALLRAERSLVEDICWHNLPATRIAAKHPRWLARFAAAMDRVADHLRY